MNQYPVGIGAYATPCACQQRRNAVGSNGSAALSEMTWVLGIGAVVLLGITAVVLSRSFKEAGF